MSVDDSPRRFLIASLGSIGRRHLANLKTLIPHAEVAVLRTGSIDAALPVGVVAQFHSLDEAMAFRPQAAIVASPASVHVAVAAPLLRAGIPVLIEKPLATSTAELDELDAAAAQGQARAAVAYNLRFMPSLLQVREKILAGAIGEVRCVRAEVGQYLPDWRPGTPYRSGVSARKDLGGGALLELSHEIDYLRWIFGAPRWVTARGGSLGELGLEVEDAVELCLDYDQPRRLVNIHLDFLQRVPHRSCRFIGAEGTLVWDAAAGSIDIGRSGGAWERTCHPMADRNAMYLEELADFLSLVRGGASRLPSLDEGRGVLAVVDAARKSMQSNQTVEVQTHASPR
jgi:predicted dehydrogenase